MLFLDADDWLEPTAVSELQTCLVERPGLDVCYGQPYRFGPRRSEVTGVARLSPFSREKFTWRAFGCVTCFVRTTRFFAVGGFREGMEVWEDPDLWSRVMAEAGVVAVQASTTFFMRRVGQSSPRIAVSA